MKILGERNQNRNDIYLVMKVNKTKTRDCENVHQDRLNSINNNSPDSFYNLSKPQDCFRRSRNFPGCNVHTSYFIVSDYFQRNTIINDKHFETIPRNKDLGFRCYQKM